jgi:hypothetical protein
MLEVASTRTKHAAQQFHTATGVAPTSQTIDVWAISRSREKNQSASPDNYRDFLLFIKSSGADVSRYTVVSLTSRDGGSVRPRAKFWSA